jgi:hypothetical protein
MESKAHQLAKLQTFIRDLCYTGDINVRKVETFFPGLVPDKLKHGKKKP